MDRKKLLVILSLIIVIAAGVFVIKYIFLDKNTSSISSIRIESYPTSTLFINGKSVGQTPYLNNKMSPGDYQIKLLVTGVSGTFQTWESKIKLLPDGQTYVSRDIGKSEEESGGQILWLEKLPSGDSVELALVSDPEQARLKIDGLEKGTAPNIIKEITPGNHEIMFSKEGYSDQIIKGQVFPGFRLNALVKLAKISFGSDLNLSGIGSNSAIKSPVISSSSGAQKNNPEKPYVIVSETGTGFLRVRSDPSIAATETAKVIPGQTFPLISETVGWVKIQLATMSGWVSDQFVQKIK